MPSTGSDGLWWLLVLVTASVSLGAVGGAVVLLCCKSIRQGSPAEIPAPASPPLTIARPPLMALPPPTAPCHGVPRPDAPRRPPPPLWRQRCGAEPAPRRRSGSHGGWAQSEQRDSSRSRCGAPRCGQACRLTERCGGGPGRGDRPAERLRGRPAPPAIARGAWREQCGPQCWEIGMAMRRPRMPQTAARVGCHVGLPKRAVAGAACATPSGVMDAPGRIADGVMGQGCL